jgi:hypothetical protein
MLDDAALQAEWNTALADAEMPGERVRLFVVAAAQSSDHAFAVWHRPELELVRDHDYPQPLDVRIANAPENINAHRIVVWKDATAPLVGATLRHELEHARQFDALGVGVFALYDVIKLRVLPHQAGGLDGCAGTYINAIPAERDANAAASMYLRKHHAGPAQAIRSGERRNLACSILPPEPHATLPRRMIAFLALHPSACAAYAAAEGEDFSDLLERAYTGAGAIWRAIASAGSG